MIDSEKEWEKLERLFRKADMSESVIREAKTEFLEDVERMGAEFRTHQLTDIRKTLIEILSELRLSNASGVSSQNKTSQEYNINKKHSLSIEKSSLIWAALQVIQIILLGILIYKI